MANELIFPIFQLEMSMVSQYQILLFSSNKRKCIWPFKLKSKSNFQTSRIEQYLVISLKFQSSQNQNYSFLRKFCRQLNPAHLRRLTFNLAKSVPLLPPKIVKQKVSKLFIPKIYFRTLKKQQSWKNALNISIRNNVQFYVYRVADLQAVIQVLRFQKIYKNQDKIMTTKSGKWTSEEETMLRGLKAKQIEDGETNWEDIASEMNSVLFTKKTAKQCRERYVNYIKFEFGTPLNLEWTPEEIQCLVRSYIEFGSCWSLISLRFVNKSENCIKNKFNNSLRKASKVINEYEMMVYKNCKRSTNFEVISVLIDLTNKIQKMAAENDLKLSHDSLLIQFRFEILNFCFYRERYTNEQLETLIKLIKSLSIKLRCFGAFKVKNRKNWKLTKSCLQSICLFDKIINFDNLKVDCLKSQLSEKDDQKLNSPTYNTNIQQQNSDLPALPRLEESAIQSKKASLDQELFDILGFDDQHYQPRYFFANDF